MSDPYTSERAVLGCILLDNSSLYAVSSTLSPADFRSASNRKIYQSILDLTAQAKPVDAITLTEKGIETKETIAIMEEVVSAANIAHYAEQVKGASYKRQLAEIGDVCRGLSESKESALECVREVERLVLGLRGVFQSERTKEISSLVGEMCQEIREHAAKGGGTSGQPSGIRKLDEFTNGFQPGEVIVLAGRPSMGKSSVATQVLLNIAAEGKHCVFFSLEMSHRMCAMRMASQISKLSMKDMGSGQLSASELEKLEKASTTLRDYKIWIDETGGISVPEVNSVCRRIKAESGALDFVVVDYLQLCGGTEGEGRERDVAASSAGLKALAKEFRCPVLMLSQLNRSCEERQDKRPRLADLRESGAIEQDADAVIMAYRDHVYSTKAKPSDMELIIRKQRNGPLGTVKVVWHPSSMSVSDV